MLRTPDLIAKLSRVTLKDTIRVLIAADLAAWYKGISFEEMLTEAADAGLSSARPEPENVAACEQAYYDLNTRLKTDAPMRSWAKHLKTFM